MRPQFSKSDYLDFVAKLQKLEKQLDRINTQKRKLDNEELEITRKILKFKRLIEIAKGQFR
jgi:hypothetical protein